MAFCTICGAQLEPNAKFCVICGAKAVEIPTQPAQPAQPTDPVQPAPAVTGFYNAQPDPTQPPAPDAEQTPPDAQQTPPPPPQPSYQPVTQQQPFNTQQQQTVPPTANGFDPQDIQRNKIMAALAYVGWLILIPLFVRRESPFTRFHCNQGLILAFAWLAIVVLRSVSASSALCPRCTPSNVPRATAAGGRGGRHSANVNICMAGPLTFSPRSRPGFAARGQARR